MHGIIFIFQICAMRIAFNCFPEIVKVDDGILNRQTLLTLQTLFRVFQFMFLHRRIATNNFFFKIDLKQAESCSFCGESTETLAHLFWYCRYTQKFWKDIYQWITQNTNWNKPVAFSLLIYLGLIDNISDLLLHVHHLFLIDKRYDIWYIWHQRVSTEWSIFFFDKL